MHRLTLYDPYGARSILVPDPDVDARMMSYRGMTESSSLIFHRWYLQASAKARIHKPKGCVLLDLGGVLSRVTEPDTMDLGDALDHLDLPTVICTRGHAGLYHMMEDFCPYRRFVEVFAHGIAFVSECNAARPYRGGRCLPLEINVMPLDRWPLELCPAIDMHGDKGDLAALLPYPTLLVDDKMDNLNAVLNKGKVGSAGFYVEGARPDINDWLDYIEEWANQL